MFTMLGGCIHNSTQQNLPHLNLASWPIKQLTFKNVDHLKIGNFADDDDDKAFLGHATQLDIANRSAQEKDSSGVSGREDHNGENNVSKNDCKIVLPQKRSYERKIRPMGRTSKNATCEIKCSFQHVHNVATIDCCEQKCCQMADRMKILQLSLDFWGQSYSNRSTYI